MPSTLKDFAPVGETSKSLTLYISRKVDETTDRFVKVNLILLPSHPLHVSISPSIHDRYHAHALDLPSKKERAISAVPLPDSVLWRSSHIGTRNCYEM